MLTITLAVCDARHALYESKHKPTMPGSRMDYGGYDSHSSGGVEVGPKLYLNLVASLLGQVRFWRLEVLEGSINVSRVHDWWTGRRRVVGGEVDFHKTPVVLWDAERGSSGTARAPGLASASMTTRLGLSWNAGDPVVESSPHRCRWRRLEDTTLASTRLTLSTIPFLPTGG